MKGLLLKDINDIEIVKVDRPQIAAGQVLVKVGACGICGSDVPRAYSSGAHNMPLIIGHEFAGTVVECGADTDNRWQNKRVGIFPLIPCGECSPCLSQKYEMCRHYDYLGSRSDGGFAEYVVVPEWNVIELPDNVSFEAAAMLEPMAVAVHAIRRLDINKDSSVVICGLGTIGLLVTMFLLEMGVSKLYVMGNKNSQKRMAVELGIEAENYCDVTTNDCLKWIQNKTDGAGTDIFIECVGRNETVSLAVDATAPAGQIVWVGNPATDMCFDKDTYWKVLRNQLRISGTWNSSFTKDEADDWHYVIDCLTNERICPEKLITHRFSLDDIIKGFELMRDKSEDYIKVMMTSQVL